MLEIILGRLQLDNAGVVVYKGTKLNVPAAELWKENVLDVHGALHLSPQQTWQEVHVSVGLAQLCIVVSVIGVTAMRVFLQLGKTYATTDRKLGIPKDFVERTIRSFCRRELICEVRASPACPSKLPD